MTATAGSAPKLAYSNRRSERIEMHAERILALVEATPDMTLTEIRAALGEEGATLGSPADLFKTAR
jgi:hypothetical protein